MSEHSIYGISVRTSPHIPARKPKIQLRAAAPVSDGFRREMNAWLLAMFGDSPYFLVVNESAIFGSLGMGGDRKTIITHPANVALLRAIFIAPPSERP